MSYRLSKRSLSRLCGVHPNLGFMVTEAIRLTGVDFAVMEGVRSLETQREYVARGVSRTMDSYHLYGLAIDLAPYIAGQVRYEETPMRKVVETCKAVNATHGLQIDNGWDLWGWDLWHFQLTGKKDIYDWRTLKCDPS